MGRKSTIPDIEQRIGEPLGDYLRKQVHLFKKPPEIAKDLGVSMSKLYEFIGVYELKDLLKQKSRETPSEIPGGELKKIIDNFIKAKTVGERSPQTVLGYENSFKQFLVYLDDKGINPTVEAYNSQNLQDFFHYLRTESSRWGGKTTSVAMPSTVLNYYKKFKALGFWMVKQEIIEKNPIKKVETPTVPKSLPEDLPDDDIKKLFASFGDSFKEVRNKTIIVLFLDTGMRMGGMMDLTVDTIDMETGWGMITEKGAKQRKIHITEKALKQLQLYLDLRNPIAKCKWLWIHEDGSRFAQHSAGSMIHSLNDRGVSEHRIHAHLFRHVWAKKMAMHGVSLLALQIMGGWETIGLVRMYAAAYSTEKAWDEHEAASPITDIMD